MICVVEKKIRWWGKIRLEKVVSIPNKFFKNFNSIINSENFQPSVNSDKYPWIVNEKLKAVDSFNSSENDSNHHSGSNKEAKINWQKNYPKFTTPDTILSTADHW